MQVSLIDIGTSRKSHDLVEIYESMNSTLNLSDEEIKEVLDFTDNLFHQVCTILNIDPEEVKK